MTIAMTDGIYDAGMLHGDARDLLPLLPAGSVDLFLTSPPYADARAYARIRPDEYVQWFLPFAEAMLAAAAPTGSLVLNVKERVVKGQRHPYVIRLVLALVELGWRWVETYIWQKPNAMPGRFGPRTKDAFEHVYHFAAGSRPYFDLDSVRVPYRTSADEIARRATSDAGRRTTEAGFGRDRAGTYLLGGADPGNVIPVPQTYNQHRGVKHPAPMPEGLAEFFVNSMCPPGGTVIDPFAGSGTTVVAARRLGRRGAGFDIHAEYVEGALDRLAALAAGAPQEGRDA